MKLLLISVVALLLFVGLIINVVNIVLSYRLFKILETVRKSFVILVTFCATTFVLESNSRLDQLD